MDIMTSMLTNSNIQNLDSLVLDLKSLVLTAARDGTAAHEVERSIFQKVLQVGYQSLEYFFNTQGDGDLGETLTSDDGNAYQRLENRTRLYRSIFGCHELSRAAYGTYESKRIDIYPLDARLQLPERQHSYLLQEWSQIISVEVPFEKTMELLKNILPITMSVDTIEQITQSVGKELEGFCEKQRNEDPPKLDKSAILVLSADGKGVPIKHPSDTAKIESYQKKRGPKPDRKRMAVVGSAYVTQPHQRTPEQLVEALFHLSDNDGDRLDRPNPEHKRVIANLTRDKDGTVINATQATFSWLDEQAKFLDPNHQTEHVLLMDGQPSLWCEAERSMPDENRTEILDLLHATSRLWDMTNTFYSSDDPARYPFIKERVLRMLNGNIKSVVSGARQMATKRRLSKAKRSELEVACRYLEKNSHRMHYNEYLEKGLPIASGVIEGACRHFVKDRMERAGMQWTITGAQAMLNVRAIKLNGDWEEFVKYRIEKETRRLYPRNDAINQIVWPIAA